MLAKGTKNFGSFQILPMAARISCGITGKLRKRKIVSLKYLIPTFFLHRVSFYNFKKKWLVQAIKLLLVKL